MGAWRRYAGSELASLVSDKSEFECTSFVENI